MLITIEGNIGSGKSTLINYLSDIPDIHLIHEPVGIWRNISGRIDSNSEECNILDAYYQDSKRWSYTFQTFAFITRYMELKKYVNGGEEGLRGTLGSPIILSERSHLSDKYIFAETLRQEDKISELEMNMYNYWFESLSKEQRYSKIIYVRTDPLVAFNRIKKRGRPEEECITLDFITRIHQAHETWLMNEQNIEVLVLDGNQEISDNQDIMELHKNSIIQFIRA